MKEAFLFFDLQIFSYRVKDQLQYPRKIYAIDSGFAHFSGFKSSEDAGRLMENLVAVELFCFKMRFENRTAYPGNLRFRRRRDQDKGKESVDKSD